MTFSARRRDERGAIMVIALFFAIFGVAMLYTLVGTAHTIFLRERLQDAADSAALSGAVVQARSMNLLVLINIVMAALLAILVTLKVVESVAILGIILASALAWITGGSTLSAVPPLKELQQEMHETYADLKPPIYEALTTLHEASDIVKQVAPVAGLAVVEADIATHSAPAKGFVAPSRLDLPVEDDSFAELCGRAGALPAEIAGLALESAHIPGGATLGDALGEGIHALAKSFSGWFCGDTNGGSASTPQLSRTVEQSYPKVATVDSELCSHVDSDDDDTNDKPSKQEVEDACERSHDLEDAGKPDEQTGGCRKGADCSLEGPYEVRIKLAREQCDPTASPPPFAYWYQQRTGHVVYEWTDKGWKRHAPLMGEPVRMGGEKGLPQPPCIPKSVDPAAIGYNKIVHPHDDVAETLPVCTTEKPPAWPPAAEQVRGALAPQDFVEVTQILGCQKREPKQIPITAGEQAGSQSSDKSSKKLEKDVVMGDESFQLRSLMWAPVHDSAKGMIELALWKTEKPKESLAVLQPLRGLAVAQAEYFYDGSDEDWMWSMRWRGRLRRFRLQDSEWGKVKDACSAVPDLNCDEALAALANAVNVINH